MQVAGVDQILKIRIDPMQDGGLFVVTAVFGAVGIHLDPSVVAVVT